MALRSGTRIGPYEVVALLGAGGMGEVYRARDPRLGREVALKVLPAGFAADAERLRRFEQEAHAAAALNHPNILAIYDLGAHDGAPYVVSELLEGQTLRQRLEAGGALPLRQAGELAQQILHGLAAAHAKGIVHRDLKPENLFLIGEGRLKILDFGLAKLRPASFGEGETAAGTETMTQAGVVLGTVGYMSPEQVRGKPVDARSDLFSFGAVLYEMLSGRRAFRRETPADTMSAILSAEPPPLASEDRPLPPALERIVEHCLVKDPEERFQSARDVAFALDALSSGSGATAALPAPAAQGVTRRGLLTGLGGGLVVGGLAATGTYLLGRRAVRRPSPSFQLLTFRRGTVTGARFTPDGKSAIYSAAWDGEPSQLFSTFLGSPEARPLDLREAIVLSVSPRGELAVLLTEDRNTFNSRGTLARVPLAGGAARPILEDVRNADWGPDGESLCVERWVDDTLRLEYPIGKVLLEADVLTARISPRGDRVAFMGDEGVEVVDLEGNHTVLTRDPFFLIGLAWSADGEEVWFTGGESAIDRALYAVDLAGKQRLLARAPGSLALHDVSREGRALVGTGFGRWGVVGFPAGEAAGRELGIFSRSALSALSTDGRKLLIADWSHQSGPDSPIYLRDIDGSAPVRLGEGAPLALSPDGRWALCRVGSTTPASPPRLVELPTGPGEARGVDLGDLEPGGEMRGSGWSLDERRLFVAAREKERPWRIFVRQGESGAWRPVTPEGVAGPFVASPDGARVAARPPGGSVTLYPVDGGSPRELSGERGVPIHWSSDGRFLYLRDSARQAPAVIAQVDLATGKRRPWKSLMPADPAGITIIQPVLLSGDASAYAYAYSRNMNELYLAEGLG